MISLFTFFIKFSNHNQALQRCWFFRNVVSQKLSIDSIGINLADINTDATKKGRYQYQYINKFLIKKYFTVFVSVAFNFLYLNGFCFIFGYKMNILKLGTRFNGRTILLKSLLISKLKLFSDKASSHAYNSQAALVCHQPNLEWNEAHLLN